MKIRINELKLKSLIREAIEEYINKTDRKIINKNKFTGDYEQLFAGEGVDNVPSFVVIVSNFKNQDTFDEFIEYASDRIVKGGGNEKYDSGIGYFNARLDGTINQLFGTPIQADYHVSRDASVSTVQQDPIGFTYSPLSKEKCPLEFDDYGYVHPKQGAENLFQGFDVYGPDCEGWIFATAHQDKGEVIFFFDDVANKNMFVRAIKNMFMIAEHTVKNGKTVYSFKTNQNPQFSIVEYGGEGGIDPTQFLDPAQDKDIIEAIQRIIQGQQDAKDEEDRMSDPEYLSKKAEEEEEERIKRANLALGAYAPIGMADNSALSSYKIGGVGTKDGLAETKLKRMIKESIRKTMKNRQ